MDDAQNGEGLIPYPAGEDIAEKIEVHHGIEWHEVEEVFESDPHIELIVASDQYGEARYAAMGQTAAGRYLYVVSFPSLEKKPRSSPRAIWVIQNDGDTNADEKA